MTELTPTTAATGPHLTLPPAEFYWAVLTSPDARAPVPALASLLPRLSGLRRLSYQFEEHLPVPLEDLHLAFARHADIIIACAIERARIRPLISPLTRTLTPASLPEWLQGPAADDSARPAPDPKRWNILTGDAEPRCVARARGRCVLALAAALLAALTIAALGVQRRIAQLSSSADAAHARTAAAYARAFGPSAGRQPPAVRLTAELRDLERRTAAARQAPDGPSEARRRDAPLQLARLLARVPPIALDVESVDITPDRIALVALVTSTDDAQTLAHALSPASSDFPWQLRQPHITSEHTPTATPQVRISLTLDPAPEPTP